MNRHSITHNLMSLFLLLLVCAFPPPAQAHRTRPPETARNYLPKKFIITEFLVVATVIEWNGKTLRYQVDGLEAESPVIWAVYPTPHAWRQFWKEMDAVHLWNWKAEYTLPASVGGVADGEEWKVEIQQQGKDGKKCKSSGSNCYPSDVDVTRPADMREHKLFEHSRVFNRYKTSIDNLLNGGKHIRVKQ